MGQVKNNHFVSTATVAVGDCCETNKFMRSRIDELEFQKARGWLDVRMAADYLGITPKTLYNLKSSSKLQSSGNRKLMFAIAELDKYLKRR